MKERINLRKCDHEFDPKTIKWSPNYGRVGICRKCKAKIYSTRIDTNPRRIKLKMKKKQRRKLRKEQRRNQEVD